MGLQLPLGFRGALFEGPCGNRLAVEDPCPLREFGGLRGQVRLDAVVLLLARRSGLLQGPCPLHAAFHRGLTSTHLGVLAGKLPARLSDGGLTSSPLFRELRPLGRKCGPDVSELLLFALEGFRRVLERTTIREHRSPVLVQRLRFLAQVFAPLIEAGRFRLDFGLLRGHLFMELVELGRPLREFPVALLEALRLGREGGLPTSELLRFDGQPARLCAVLAHASLEFLAGLRGCRALSVRGGSLVYESFAGGVEFMDRRLKRSLASSHRPFPLFELLIVAILIPRL